MRERLLEHWLDRINERGYQPVFCQALAEKGHTVIHSTRHGPMEFGKDVVSRDEHGNYCAFQLKGNPGGRLTIGQWNEILPQINALMLQPIEPPLSATSILAKPYLVTNGEVDEEVHAAIRGINSIASAQGRPELLLISRGDLLGDYIRPIADKVWPPGIEVDQHILKCWNIEGIDYFDPELFHNMLSVALPFAHPPKTSKNLERALFGAALINEFCLRRYVDEKNYVATIFGRALFLAASYSVTELAKLPPTAINAVRELLWASIADDFISLIDNLERNKKRNYYDKDVHLEFVYHQQRLFLLKSILSVMALCLEKQPQVFQNVANQAKEKIGFIRQFIDFKLNNGIIGGEYVISQFLLVYWYCCTYSGGNAADKWLPSILATLLKANSSKENAAQVPDPYHLMPEVIDSIIDSATGGNALSKRKVSFQYQLWSALVLFGLIVRRNMKSSAKTLFSRMTRFIHRKTAPDEAWEYGRYRATNAQEIGERLTFPGNWQDYVTRSHAPEVLNIPKGLSDDLMTLGLFLIVCPFRLNEDVAFFLDDIFVGSWHTKIPEQ